MKKFRFKSLIAALAAVIFAVPMASAPAFANSGPPWEEGVTSTGIHCVHENSVLEVKDETLTFNIGTPYYELQEGEKYNSTVTAEYTFYNPTAETVNTKMAFPIGLVPYYAQGNEKYNKIENPITVDGQPIDYTVRHTYGTYNSFEKDVRKIRDTYYETDFFKVDLPVTEYVFKVNLEGNDFANFEVEMPRVTGTRFFSGTDGGGNFSYSLYNGDKFSIFVLGNDCDLSNLNWSATRYSSLFNRHIQVNGSVTFEKKMEPKTFKEYVLRGYDTLSDVSEVDYFNAIFEMINLDGVWAGNGLTPVNSIFTEWYVYETSVAPGGTFKNAVTANLYPTTYYNYTPYLYEYNYYLSPAREWASFGNLTVNINTTQYLQKCDYYDPFDAENSTFVKTETGYTATFTSLPTTELTFTTSTDQTPSINSDVYDDFYLEFIAALGAVYGFVLIVIPLIGGAVFLIIFSVKRKRRRASAQAQTPSPDTNPSPDPSAELPPVTDETGEGIVEGQTEGENAVCREENAQPIVEEQEELAEQVEVINPNFCAYCGSKLEKDVNFCPNCGVCVKIEKPVQPVQPTQPEEAEKPAQTQSVPVKERKVNIFAIIGFALSAASLVLMFVWYLSVLLVTPGLALSITGLILRKKYNRVNGLAIAGVAIGGVVAFIFVCVCAYLLLVVFILILAGLAIPF